MKLLKNRSLVLIAFLGLTLAGVAVTTEYIYGQSTQRSSSGSDPIGSNNLGDEMQFRLGSLQQIHGSKHYLAELKLEKKGFSRARFRKIRNVLFFKGEALKQAWLFPNHNSEILLFEQLASEVGDQQITYALLVEFAERDTNGDGTLDREDDVSVAVTRPSGDGFTILEENVRSIQGRVFDHDEKAMVLLVSQAGKVMVKKYSLETFQKLSEQEVTNISEPVHLNKGARSN